MTDSLDDLLGTNDSPGQASGGQLRKQLEAILAERNELKAQLAQVQQTNRATALESLFTKHGVPPLARDLFPQDAEPTDEAVTGLVEKYGSLWGAQSAAATTPPAEQQAAQQMQQFAQMATPPTPAGWGEEHYRSMFSEAKTKDDLLTMLGALDAHASNAVEG